MPPGTRTVLELVDAGFVSASLGAALELGLFWLLDERPQPITAIARQLGIPPVRCGYWLQMLVHAGLIDEGRDGFRPSSTARTAILGAYSRETWGLLAQEARERLPVPVDFVRLLSGDGTPGEPKKAGRPDYVTLMAADSERARRFTRMLYELHRPVADKLARRIDMAGVGRMVDVGGGSGVVSMALARQHSALAATVVDLATVCDAGRELAIENGLENRVTYHAADFQRDDLPGGFDLALMCDVGVYGPAVFGRIGAALNRHGRLVVADTFAPASGIPPASRLIWAFERSLTDPGHIPPTAEYVQGLLDAAGFRVRSCDELRLPDEPDPLTVIDAERR